jgi:hypothetical protein
MRKKGSDPVELGAGLFEISSYMRERPKIAGFGATTMRSAGQLTRGIGP